MLAEALEWLVTPASSLARRSGLLAGQIAIRHRASRCRSLWHGHLQATRRFITSQVAALTPHPQQVIVLGSGHLNDIDLDALLELADHVVLVDIVHPLEVRWRSFRAGGRIELLEADLSGSLENALAGGKRQPRRTRPVADHGYHLRGPALGGTTADNGLHVAAQAGYQDDDALHQGAKCTGCAPGSR